MKSCTVGLSINMNHGGAQRSISKKKRYMQLSIFKIANGWTFESSESTPKMLMTSSSLSLKTKFVGRGNVTKLQM